MFSNDAEQMLLQMQFKVLLQYCYDNWSSTAESELDVINDLSLYDEDKAKVRLIQLLEEITDEYVVVHDLGIDNIN